MIAHLTKIIWKNNRRNFLLMLQIMVSFLVCFVLCTLGFQYLYRYHQPLGYDYEDVWVMKMTNKGGNEAQTIGQIEQAFLNQKGVIHVSNCDGNIPYAMGTSSTGLKSNITGKYTQCLCFTADDSFSDLMKIPMVEGRWFNQSDEGQSLKAMVIDMETRQALFQDQPALGQTVNGLYRVVGVIDRYRVKGELAEKRAVFFARKEENNVQQVLLIRVTPGSDIVLEEKLSGIAASYAKDWTIKMTSLEKMRSSHFRQHLIPLAILAFIGLFLILNVMLGLFGILWYNINHRRKEIGLRRAVGASVPGIQKQFIFEMGLLTTLAILPALLLAINISTMGLFGVQGTIYGYAILAALLFIYLLVVLCAFIPGKQAARIQPALALQEE